MPVSLAEVSRSCGTSAVSAQPSGIYRVWIECDESAWAHNFRAIRKHVDPCTLIPVLKANAYGLGAEVAATSLARAGAQLFSVSSLYEARQIRGAGVPVLILGGVLPGEIPQILQDGFTSTVADFAMARLLDAEARRVGCRAKIHMKVDTGMGRLGFRGLEAVDAARALTELPGLELEGIYSHFAAAGRRDALTTRQHESLAELIQALADAGITFRFRHIASSAAIAGIAETRHPPFNAVRSGLDLCGAHLSITPRPYTTRPVMTALKSRLLSVRHLPVGATVGYGRTYTVSRPGGQRIGTVAIGYADGYPRCLSNFGHMLVRGRRCPVVGRICMDYSMVLLDDVPDARSGDEVVVIGRQGEAEVTLNEVARAAETIPYEIISCLGARIERQYY